MWISLQFFGGFFVFRFFLFQRSRSRMRIGRRIRLFFTILKFFVPKTCKEIHGARRSGKRSEQLPVKTDSTTEKTSCRRLGFTCNDPFASKVVVLLCQLLNFLAKQG